MAFNSPATYQFDRPVEGFTSSSTNRLRTGYNLQGSVLKTGRALTYAADQSISSVFASVRTINATTDVVIGFSVANRVGMPYIDPLQPNSELNTVDASTGLGGYGPRDSVAYSEDQDVYVVSETAAVAGNAVHARAVATVTFPEVGRIRSAAVAGETTPATGWIYRESCSAGQSVRIGKP